MSGSNWQKYSTHSIRVDYGIYNSVICTWRWRPDALNVLEKFFLFETNGFWYFWQSQQKYE